MRGCIISISHLILMIVGDLKQMMGLSMLTFYIFCSNVQVGGHNSSCNLQSLNPANPGRTLEVALPRGRASRRENHT